MSFVPSPLTHSSAPLLEFAALRDLVRGYASSSLGRNRVDQLVPSLDFKWIETQHRLTSDIRESDKVE